MTASQRQRDRGVDEQPDQHDHEVEAKRPEGLESRRGNDRCVDPEDSDRRRPDDQSRHLHHRLKRRLEEIAQLGFVRVFQLGDEVTEQDAEEDDREYIAFGQRLERVLRNDSQ
jgi:hypothetical protein